MEWDRRLGNGDYKYERVLWNICEQSGMEWNRVEKVNGYYMLFWGVLVPLPPLTIILPQYDQVLLPRVFSKFLRAPSVPLVSAVGYGGRGSPQN
jgi:hypothetical protein